MSKAGAESLPLCSSSVQPLAGLTVNAEVAQGIGTRPGRVQSQV